MERKTVNALFKKRGRRRIWEHFGVDNWEILVRERIITTQHAVRFHVVATDDTACDVTIDVLGKRHCVSSNDCYALNVWFIYVIEPFQGYFFQQIRSIHMLNYCSYCGLHGSVTRAQLKERILSLRLRKRRFHVNLRRRKTCKRSTKCPLFNETRHWRVPTRRLARCPVWQLLYPPKRAIGERGHCYRPLHKSCESAYGHA
jgi:hypothetical protein